MFRKGRFGHVLHFEVSHSVKFLTFRTRLGKGDRNVNIILVGKCVRKETLQKSRNWKNKKE
jgi:hypothetical protein